MRNSPKSWNPRWLSRRLCFAKVSPVYFYMSKTFVVIDEFRDVLVYAKGLEFEEKPNYDYIKNHFKNLFNRTVARMEGDILMDWQQLRKQKRDEKKKAKQKYEDKL